jgi:hypothetical protein
MTARLPAHLEVSAIRRLAESQCGFATVLAKGDPDAGAIALAIMCRGEGGMLLERMPQPDGNRPFVTSLMQDAENVRSFSAALARKRERDPDLWLIEVDVPDIPRFAATLPD